MSKRIGNYVRQQHLALLALFLVVAGGTALAVSAPKNSVKSKSVKNEALKSLDLKDGAAVAGADVVDDSLKGADVDESSLNLGKVELPESLPPKGPAGGALTGQYPNPSIGANSVASPQIADNQVSGADVDESSLGTVPAALIATQGGLGRYGSSGFCDPESETFIPCSVVSVTLAAPARLLVIGTVRARTEPNVDRAYGSCRIGTTSGPVSASAVEVAVLEHDDIWTDDELASVVAVTNPLPAGTHGVGIDCLQDQGAGAIYYEQARVVTVALSAA